MQRSSDVSLVAIVQFVLSGVLVLVAGGAVIGGSFFGAMLGGMTGSPMGLRFGGGLGLVAGIGIAMFLLFRAALNFVCGWGIWTLKEWARILTIVLCAFSLLWSIRGVFRLMFFFHMGLFGLWSLFWLGVNIWIIFTLMQPRTRAQFR